MDKQLYRLHESTAFYWKLMIWHNQCSRLSWKSCRSWAKFWEIQTSICKEMCKKLLVLTKSCWSRTDGPALVSNTGHNTRNHNKTLYIFYDTQYVKPTYLYSPVSRRHVTIHLQFYTGVTHNRKLHQDQGVCQDQAEREKYDKIVMKNLHVCEVTCNDGCGFSPCW